MAEGQSWCCQKQERRWQVEAVLHLAQIMVPAIHVDGALTCATNLNVVV